MSRGGRRIRTGNGRFPPAHGPPMPMCPPQPPPPDMGWHGPPFPGGHPGYPDPDLMDDFRPVMEPPYGPMDEPGFGPMDHDFRGRADRFHGPPMMDVDYGPPMMDADYGPIHDMGHGPNVWGRAPPGHPHPGHPPHGHLPTRPPHPGYPRPRHPYPGHPHPGYPHPGHLPPAHHPPGHLPPGHPPPGYPPPMPGPPIPEMPPQLEEQQGPAVSKKPEPQKKPKLPPKRCSKPPPGRFQGIISFIGADYGFIERDDLKKLRFSFDAFWGSTTEMIPGVRVQFTVCKDRDMGGKECATDVVVPPGGTEEVDGDILEGVVSRAPECLGVGKSRKLTLPKHAGTIQATMLGDLPYTTHDYGPTLLLGDRVQFNLLTDLVTKEQRATNIALMPNTFQFTNESRETGVVMDMKDGGSGSIMAEEWSNLCFDADDNLSDTELRVMDEVEFTVVPVQGKEQHKAVRVRRLPEGTVTFGQKTRERIAEALEKNSTRFSMEEGKWKAVTNEVLPQRTVVFEDVGSEQYEGTIIMTAPCAQGQEKAEADSGLLVATVAGADRNLPFDSGDVTSEATMMPGDHVQFNICTKRGTKAERATNIELLPDGLNYTQEQREKGVVTDLRESFGFIKCQRDPQLFFHLKEVLEENKLNLTDEVEFTVLPASAGEGNQAVRVKKLLWSAFTATPKLEGLGAPSKEKKKMTIKLLRDSVNDEMKNLKVKIESFSTESATDEDPTEPMDEDTSSGKQGVGDLILPKSENGSQPVKMNEEGGGMDVKAQETSSWNTPRQKKDTKKESRNGAHGGGGTGGSFERSHRYEHRHIRSCSRERSGRNGSSSSSSSRRRSRSRSRERADSYSRRRSRSRSRERADSHSRRHGSRESTTNQGGARWANKSRSPERDGGSRKKVGTSDEGSFLAKDKQGGREPLPRAYPNPAIQDLPRSENIVDKELSRKKRELELLEEHIARRRAIIAMEQKGLAPKGRSNDEQDSGESSGYFRVPPEPKSVDKPAPLPMKSILKKRTEHFTEYCQQSEIPKSPPLKPNFVSQSCFGPAPVDLPPFLQTSDEPSYFEPPPDRSRYGQSVSQREPVCHPSQTSDEPSYFEPPLDRSRYSQSVSQREAVCHPSHSQSAVHQPPLDQPPVCQSPPRQQVPTQNTASTQFERFLRTLNRGVDAELLSSVVKDVGEGGFAREAVESQIPPQGEVFYNRGVDAELLSSLVKEIRGGGFAREAVESQIPTQGEDFYKDKDQYEDSHGMTTEDPDDDPDDFLLPHERAFLDGGGFSCIVGMKHGLQVEEKEDSWREGDADDDEHFLYGKRTDKGKHGSTTAEVDQRSWEPRQAETEPKPSEGKMPHYDKIQSLLQTIGLNLDMSEVSKLADRTQERLYGKKQKSPGQVDCASGRATGRSGRRRSQTDSPESDRTHSISPVSASRREVYMSVQSVLEHSSTRDEETFATDARTVQSLQKSCSPSHSTPSSSKYSHVPQEPYSQYQSTSEHELAYSQQASATITGWNQVPRQAEVQSPTAFSQYPGSYVVPQYPGSYATPPSPYGNVPVGPHAVPPFLPPHSLPHVTMASPVGLSTAFLGSSSVPLPSFFQQPPPTFSGATSYFPLALHPLTGAPIRALGRGSAFPVSQPVAVGGEVETKKSRCLTVIKTVKTVKFHSNLTTAKDKNLKEVTITSTPSSDSTPTAAYMRAAPSESAEKKQVTAISEDDIKAKQKKRLEQFNERMRQKKEQQMQAKRSRVEREKIPPGRTCTEVKNVWVCGHSLVFWAEKRAKSPEYGMQLGMDPGRVRVWWKGMQGMTWDQLLPMLLQLKGSWPNPDVIILHLGGNDLGKSDLGLLLSAVKKDLASLRSIFPKCQLVWSDILPRRSWRATDDAEAMESYRTLVNRQVRANIAELGGSAVTHNSIRPGSDAGLYRPDGVHLSGKGIDMFNIDLQDFLEKWDGEETESSDPV